jgi:hypothetical protein
VIKPGLTYEQHEIGARYDTLRRTQRRRHLGLNLCGFNEPLFADMEHVARESVFGPAGAGRPTSLAEG